MSAAQEWAVRPTAHSWVTTRAGVRSCRGCGVLWGGKLSAKPCAAGAGGGPSTASASTSSLPPAASRSSKSVAAMKESELPVSARALDLMADGRAYTIKDISDHIGADMQQTRAAMVRLLKSGRVTRHGSEGRTATYGLEGLEPHGLIMHELLKLLERGPEAARHRIDLAQPVSSFERALIAWRAAGLPGTELKRGRPRKRQGDG